MLSCFFLFIFVPVFPLCCFPFSKKIFFLPFILCHPWVFFCLFLGCSDHSCPVYPAGLKELDCQAELAVPLVRTEMGCRRFPWDGAGAAVLHPCWIPSSSHHPVQGRSKTQHMSALLGDVCASPSPPFLGLIYSGFSILLRLWKKHLVQGEVPSLGGFLYCKGLQVHTLTRALDVSSSLVPAIKKCAGSTLCNTVLMSPIY